MLEQHGKGRGARMMAEMYGKARQRRWRGSTDEDTAGVDEGMGHARVDELHEWDTWTRVRHGQHVGAGVGKMAQPGCHY